MVAINEATVYILKHNHVSNRPIFTVSEFDHFVRKGKVGKQTRFYNQIN